MSILPAANYLRDGGRTEGEQKQAFEDQRGVISELLGGSAETELTISSGSITPISASHRVDTEADASSDLLDHINYTNHPDGRYLQIRAENAARNVTLVHGAGGDGQLLLANSANFTLSDTVTRVLLQRSGTTWLEVQRFIPGNQIGLNLIQTQTAAASAVIDFMTGITSTYDKYLLALTDVMPATNAVDLWLRFLQTGTPVTSGYYHSRAAHQLNTASPTWQLAGSASDAKIILAGSESNNGGHGVDMTVMIHHPSASNRVPSVNYSGLYVQSDTNGYAVQGAGVWNSQAAIDGLRIMFSSGNIQTGTLSLYGVRKT